MGKENVLVRMNGVEKSGEIFLDAFLETRDALNRCTDRIVN